MTAPPADTTGRRRQATTDPATAPLLAQVSEKGHRIAAADEKNFEYGLECILDHAERLIETTKKPAKRKR